MPEKSKKFQDVLRILKSPDSLQYSAYVGAVQATGHMDCPAPSWDLDGVYRISVRSGRLVVERLVGESWDDASLEPPAAVGEPKRIASHMQTKTRTILFMDVAGWSSLKPHEIHAYASKALPALSALLIGHDFVNTWGDAIVATFDSVKDAAESALKIRDFFRSSYPESGIVSGLSCRVSLHLGEVIWCENEIRHGQDVFGHAVHIAARLEPATTPGEVFCTRAVAERLQDVEGSAPRAWPLGLIHLPKGFGEVEAYVVTGPNAPDPRSLSVAKQPDAKQEPVVTVSDATARLRIQGWINKLPPMRSGEAIPLSEVEVACRVGPRQPYRLIPELLPTNDEGWNLAALSEEDVILSYTPPGPIVISGPNRGW